MMALETFRLLRDVRQYSKSHGGKLYAPIDHWLFRSLDVHHGPERYEAIRPLISASARSAVDIGSHWGYFSFKLESIGLQVTAFEKLPRNVEMMERIGRLYGSAVDIRGSNILDEQGLKADVVLALNIFHHFLKSQEDYERLIDFLSHLQCSQLFFQSHRMDEGQMRGAWANYAPDEFAEFVLQWTTLTKCKLIGDFRGRRLYLLS